MNLLYYTYLGRGLLTPHARLWQAARYKNTCDWLFGPCLIIDASLLPRAVSS